MDSVDIKILSCLRENARQNASVIGEKVKMSVSAVIERIRKMEANGIIQQYTVLLDNKLIGKGISAFISVSLEHPKYNDAFTQSIMKNEQIVECHYMAGDFDYMLKVVASSTEELTQILGEVKAMHGVSLTKTLVILSTVKNNPAVLPEIGK